MGIKYVNMIRGFAISSVLFGLFTAGCGGSSSSGDDDPVVDPPPEVLESGLDSRPVNTTCLAFDKPTPGSGVELQAAFQANSRVISIVDGLLQDVIEIL